MSRRDKQAVGLSILTNLVTLLFLRSVGMTNYLWWFSPYCIITLGVWLSVLKWYHGLTSTARSQDE